MGYADGGGFQPSRFNYMTSGAGDYQAAAPRYAPNPDPVGNADGGAGPGGASDPYFNGSVGTPPTAEQIAAQNQVDALNRAWNSGNSLLGFQNWRYNQQRGEYGDNYQNALDAMNWERGGLAGTIASAQQNLGMRDEIIANLQKMYGINDRELANRIAQSWLDQSVQSAVLNQQTGLNALQGLQRSQANRSAGISSGMGFFPGYRVGGEQIAEETNRNADILANKLRGVVEGGDLTRQGLNIGAEGQNISLANQILGQRQTRLGDETSLSNLQRKYGEYDIQQRGLANKYAQQLNELGYQQTSNPMEMIYKLLSSNDSNQQALGRMLAQSQGMGG